MELEALTRRVVKVAVLGVLVALTGCAGGARMTGLQPPPSLTGPTPTGAVKQLTLYYFPPDAAQQQPLRFAIPLIDE